MGQRSAECRRGRLATRQLRADEIVVSDRNVYGPHVSRSSTWNSSVGGATSRSCSCEVIVGRSQVSGSISALEGGHARCRRWSARGEPGRRNRGEQDVAGHVESERGTSCQLGNRRNARLGGQAPAGHVDQGLGLGAILRSPRGDPLVISTSPWATSLTATGWTRFGGTRA